MTRLIEKDRLRVGTPQLIMENAILSVTLVPELGGRILDVRDHKSTVSSSDDPDSAPSFLHRVYPRAVQFGPYTEYGGIEECIGSAPGHLWHVPWRVEKQSNGVLLSTISTSPFSKVLVQKSLRLHDAEPILAIQYAFVNLDTRFTRFTFGIHPEFAFGQGTDGFSNTKYCVPSDGEVTEGCFAEVGAKTFVTPDEGWSALVHKEQVLGMFFPDRVIDAIEMYYPRVGTHIVMQPMIYGVGLSPNRRACFDYWLYFGEGTAETIRDLWAAFRGKLTATYEAVAPPPQIKAPGRTHPFMHARPVVPVAENGSAVPIVPDGPLHMAPLASTAPNTRSPDNLPHQHPSLHAIQRHFQFPSAPCRSLHLIQPGGNIHLRPSATEQIQITVRGLADSEHEREAWKPEITLQGGQVLVRTPVAMDGTEASIKQIRCEITLPVAFAEIEIETDTGEVLLEGLQARQLRIRNRDGSTHVCGCLADQAHVRLTSVSGAISVLLPPETECEVEAISTTGQVECSLDGLQDNQGPHCVRGILGRPLAELHVSTVSGPIRIAELRPNGILEGVPR